MNNIKPIFTEENHKYESELGLYTSVTTLIHQYEPTKDFKEIAKTYILKRTERQLINDLSSKYNLSESEVYRHIDTLGVLEAVLHIWKLKNTKSCEEGTAYHKSKESIDLAKGASQVDIHDFDLYSLKDGKYTEMLLWNNELMIAGQADVITIETINGIRYVSIEDYKTNEVIATYNYINKNTGKPVINEYLLNPLGHLCNCNFNIYQLQLNIYGWLLERFGFRLRDMTIIHVRDNDKRYKVSNLQNEVTYIMGLQYNKLRKYMLKNPVILPIFHNSEGSSQLLDLGIESHLDDCDLKDMKFYIINAIGEYTEDGKVYTSVVSGSEVFICYLSEDEVAAKISKSLNS